MITNRSDCLYFVCVIFTIIGLSSAQENVVSNPEAHCEYVHNIENETEQCSFVQSTADCLTDGGYVNYAVALYCNFQNGIKPLGFVLYALWFLYLLLATAVTSDRFFAPNLPVIADALHLSENIAGETLLALGNGAPDFFTSLVAALSMKDGDAGILYGTLLGSGTFVTTVVLGTIIMIKPFRTMQRPLLKDIIFYMAAVFCAFATLWDGKIYIWEAAMFLVIYVLYIISVFSGPHLNKILTRMWKARRLSMKDSASVAKLPSNVPISRDHNVIDQLRGNNPADSSDLSPQQNINPIYELHPVSHDDDVARQQDNPAFVPDGHMDASDDQVNNISASVHVPGENQNAADQLEANETLRNIVNKERAVMAFASALQEQPTTRYPKAIMRQHSKSTADGTMEVQAAGLRPQRRMSAWVVRRHGQQSPNAPSSAVRSRRTSSRATPESAQRSPMMPRSARLMLRRASARLNEPVKMDDEDSNSDDEAPSTVGSYLQTPAIRGRSRFESRLESTMEAYGEDDTADKIYHIPVPLKTSQTLAPETQSTLSVLGDNGRRRTTSSGDKAVETTSRQLRFADEMNDVSGQVTVANVAVTIAEDGITGKEETEDEAEVEVVEDKPYWKWLLEGYNPIEMDEWHEQSWFGRLVQILKAPIAFIMLITNPCLDEDKQMFNWNRPTNCLHCVISPIFVLLAIVEYDIMIGDKFPLIALFALIGLAAGLAVFFTSKNTERPKYHLVFAAMGFATTVVWIYVLANEVVNLLQCFGVALDISQSILGLTCLAWGNSLGDFINNIIITRQGYSKMAISSCFGGMLFNLLLGLGVPLLIVSIKNGGVLHVAQSNVLTVLFGFLGLELASSFFAIPVIQGFYVRRPYAIYLYCIYACCIVCAILTEVDVISPNIFAFAYSHYA